jgi:4-carboxymuconolactone decarboxylase
MTSARRLHINFGCDDRLLLSAHSYTPRVIANSIPFPAQTTGKDSAMDKDLLDKGLRVRREVLGDEYVDRSMKNADEFNRRFQEIVSEYCWGVCWGDETLSRRERSILNLGMIAALGKMHEFELHFRAARRNGLSDDELRAVLTQIAVYCGIPVGVDCFRTAKQVFADKN